MKQPNSSASAGSFSSDSQDTEILIFEGGDNTLRPCSPELRKWREARRERLAKLGFNLDGTPIKPPDTSDSK